MPEKRQPPSMMDLALKAVGKFVKAVGFKMINPTEHIRMDPSISTELLERGITEFNRVLYSAVPWYLYDRVAVEALTVIVVLIEEIKHRYCSMDPMTPFLMEMKVAVKLTEVAIHPQLKQIDFSLWPKIMRHVLYTNLHRMIGLEVLDLGSGSGGWKTSNIETMIVDGLVSMKNLTMFCMCFDCTDHILSIVGENCRKLQGLDVTASRSVTDRSVNALLNCRDLRKLHLYHTSVTVDGFALLLMGIPRLEDMGRYDGFGYVFEHIRAGYTHLKPLALQVFQSRDNTSNHLKLLTEMCPKVKHVSIYHDERVGDLTVLAALDNLSELKLLSCDFFSDHIKQLLEVRGANITWLHLEHVDEIDMNALVYISQFCPNIVRLNFYNCEFLEHTSLSLKKLYVPPFQHLEHIICVAECALNQLEFLLSKCFNIRCIQLGSSTGIGDETMARVLAQNPMKQLEELKILHSDNLSMQTVQLLMSHCDNLRVLSELESWQGITETELAEFRHYLIHNNVNLDVRPTLSH